MEQNIGVIKNSGVIIEVDETLIVKRKYERGKVPAKKEFGCLAAWSAAHLVKNVF